MQASTIAALRVTTLPLFPSLYCVLRNYKLISGFDKNLFVLPTLIPKKSAQVRIPCSTTKAFTYIMFPKIVALDKHVHFYEIQSEERETARGVFRQGVSGL